MNQRADKGPASGGASPGDACLLLLIAGPFLFWLQPYLRLDLWYDEAFTLVYYILPPVRETVTNYSFPNNHILFNILSSLFLKGLNTGGVYNLLDHIELLRLPPLAFTGVTAVYVFKAGERYFSRTAGFLAVAVLFTTVPYYNFCLQVRGYGLSMMLLTLLLYHVRRLEESSSAGRALAVALLPALALYAIPLNLYFILSVAAASLITGLLVDARNRARAVAVAGLLAAGCVLAGVLYLPVWGQLVGNRFVQSHGAFHLPTLTHVMPQVFDYFMSNRYPLLLVVAGGVFYVFSGKGTESEKKRPFLFCAIVLAAPFLFSFIRGDRPFLRVFVNLSPVFALLTAAALDVFIRRVAGSDRRRFAAACAVVLYCQAAFTLAVVSRNLKLMADIKAGVKSQDIYYNYYQAHYQPLALTRQLRAELDRQAPDPPPVVLGEFDKAAMPCYLSKFNIRARGFDELGEALKTSGRAIVLTAFPETYTKRIQAAFPGVRVRMLNDEPGFHNLLEVRRKPPRADVRLPGRLAASYSNPT